jgi:NAD(P)-dependent dehydrogenase (short-subunit alcohol dehydrogenase family)
MIKSAAGGAVYLVTKANPRADVEPFFDGLIEGTGLRKGDAALMFRRHLFAAARKQAGQVLRRRDQREHVTLFIKAFNAWATGEGLTQLRYTSTTASLSLTSDGTDFGGNAELRIAYSTSKSALNMLTVQYARAFAADPDLCHIKVNAGTPGFVATALNNYTGTRSVEQGARVIVNLATLADDGPTGGFFNDQGPVP